MDARIVVGYGEARHPELREANAGDGGDVERIMQRAAVALGEDRRGWSPDAAGAWCVIVGGEGTTIEESDLDYDPAVVAHCSLRDE